MQANSIVLWVILGTLIAVVLAFLIFTSIMDKKKEKKFKEKKALEEKEKLAARGNVAIWINEIANQNNLLLSDFVPSVGKVKMGLIRLQAKKALEELLESKAFLLASGTDANNDLVVAVKKLNITNSNIWDTNCKDELDLFKKIEDDLDKEKYNEFKEATILVVKEKYESSK